MPDEEQELVYPEMGLGDVHHLHQEVGSFVRHQLTDRQQDRPLERREVVHRRCSRRHLREPADVEHRGHDAHVAVAHQLELARVVVGIGDGPDHPRAQGRDLSSTQLQKVREHEVVRREVFARSDVVVHEHERLGARHHEFVHLRLPDRRVEHQEVVRVTRSVARERQDVAEQRGIDVMRVDLRRPDSPQEPAGAECEVRDRVAGRGGDQHLVDPDAARLGHRRALTGWRRWRSPAVRTTAR
jgi:hypothetical protein